ncbi:hypothetical protein JB92DRAFT_3098167 [Gautieria morchelliformis]|nr:hypothetical protein JB92DRAFT_3098167 [Gautieria morchelliformis]
MCPRRELGCTRRQFTALGTLREENSAGSPNFGGYHQNPSIKMAVPTPMHIMVRMQLSHASPTPSRSRSSYRRSPSRPFGSNLATDDLLKNNVTPNVYRNELDIYSCEIRYIRLPAKSRLLTKPSCGSSAWLRDNSRLCCKLDCKPLLLGTWLILSFRILETLYAKKHSAYRVTIRPASLLNLPNAQHEKELKR